jgi:hypothetical protein
MGPCPPPTVGSLASGSAALATLVRERPSQSGQKHETVAGAVCPYPHELTQRDPTSCLRRSRAASKRQGRVPSNPSYLGRRLFGDALARLAPPRTALHRAALG